VFEKLEKIDSRSFILSASAVEFYLGFACLDLLNKEKPVLISDNDTA